MFSISGSSLSYIEEQKKNSRPDKCLWSPEAAEFLPQHHTNKDGVSR